MQNLDEPAQVSAFDIGIKTHRHANGGNRLTFSALSVRDKQGVAQAVDPYFVQRYTAPVR
ncbi:hypothetical protein GCM10022255_001240 [Dactylosporangium darangshiense]|uniref:Uncharacterized protein n=1 Tax=Dactylosporangium darangshiense TaxID=579108 RepID=A0ABP8CTE9_9ACTN